MLHSDCVHTCCVGLLCSHVLTCLGLAKTAHTYYIRTYGVYTVYLTGKSPYIQSYTVYIYGSGQPYTCFTVTVFTHAAQAYCVQTCYTVTVFTHVSQSLCSHMLRRPTVFKHVSQSLCSHMLHSHCVHTCCTGLLLHRTQEQNHNSLLPPSVPSSALCMAPRLV